MKKIPQSLRSCFSVDLRSLALARILIATVLIIDWFYRLLNSFEFYSDWGVLPRAQLISDFGNPLFFSVFNMAGKPFYIVALLIIGLLAHISFLIGYRTKLANFMSWVFFVSLSARMPIISHAGDDLMRLALFWMLFLPTSKFYSMDSALLSANNPEKDPKLFNISTIAITTQLIFVYFFTALIKLHPAWTTEASAVYLSLQLDQFLTPLGAIIKQTPYVATQIVTRIVWFIELFIPLFLLIPYKHTFFRYLAVITFVLFHFALFLTFKLGNFPWVCIAYWTVFLPSHYWENILTALKLKQDKVIIYYDANCKLCYKMAYVIKTFLVLPFVSIYPANNSPEKDLVQKNNSWIVVKDQKMFFKFEAFVQLISISAFSFTKCILAHSKILKWGTTCYQTVANNRPRYLGFLNYFHRTRSYNDQKTTVQLFVALCLCVATFWNIALLYEDKVKIPYPVRVVGSVFRLHQHWVMFAPYPTFEDGWVVVDAELANGQKWDIFNNQPVSFENPTSMSSMFKNSLWRKYLNNLRTKEYYGYRLYFGRYLCRLWNEKHSGDEVVNSFKVYFMLDRTVEYGKSPEPLVTEMLWSHGCFIK